MARMMKAADVFGTPGKYKSRGELASDAVKLAGLVMEGLIAVRKARGLVERVVDTVGWKALARKKMKGEAVEVLRVCKAFEETFGPDDAPDMDEPVAGGSNGDPTRG